MQIQPQADPMTNANDLPSLHSRSATWVADDPRMANNLRIASVTWLLGILCLMVAWLFMSPLALAEQTLHELGEITADDTEIESSFSGRPCHSDSYSIDCVAGDAITIDLHSQRLEAVVRVTCDELPEKVWGGRHYQDPYYVARRTLIAPVSGTYHVEVQGLVQQDLGTYELSIEQVAGQFETVFLDESAELLDDDEKLPRGELCDWYTLEASQGELIRVRFTSDAFAPYLVIVCEATGERWESYPGYRENTIDCALVVPTTSTVRIAATSAMDDGSGEYQLQVERGTYQEPLGSFAVNARHRRLPNNRPGRPRFGEPVCLANESGPLTTAQDVEGVSDFSQSAPHLADVTNDGKVDLLLGSLNGRIIYYENLCEENTGFSFEAPPVLLRYHNGDPATLKNW